MGIHEESALVQLLQRNATSNFDKRSPERVWKWVRERKAAAMSSSNGGKQKQTDEVTSSQEKELAEKDATIRALEEENKTLASELAHLLERNEELKHLTNLDPEREADRKELEVAILKKKLEMEQKAISRLTAEVSRERERRRDLMRARDRAIDAICSQLLSIPYSERRLSVSFVLLLLGEKETYFN
ncbi:rho-associated protein kinase 2-like [Crotalus tigris]|uniref:rho-associated protein kinase 2-like n=1 Tax=Crotalus tigris TaxID=88082 RepID=UPI00192F76F2|nr:rho-associated protein kinase 2-like [Crotalus tigris]